MMKTFVKKETLFHFALFALVVVSAALMTLIQVFYGPQYEAERKVSEMKMRLNNGSTSSYHHQISKNLNSSDARVELEVVPGLELLNFSKN